MQATLTRMVARTSGEHAVVDTENAENLHKIRQLKAELKRQRRSIAPSTQPASGVEEVAAGACAVAVQTSGDLARPEVLPSADAPRAASSGLGAALAGQLLHDAVPVVLSGPPPGPPNQRLVAMAVEEIQRRPVLPPPVRAPTPPGSVPPG